jgi:hypothetical protein
MHSANKRTIRKKQSDRPSGLSRIMNYNTPPPPPRPPHGEAMLIANSGWPSPFMEAI